MLPWHATLIGVGIEVLGMFLSSMGNLLMRKAQLDGMRNPVERRKRWYCRPVWYLIFVFLVANGACDFSAYQYASMAILAPLGALATFVNMVVARFLLGETISRHHAIGSAVMVAGAALSVWSGPPEPQTDPSLHQLSEYFLSSSYRIYFPIKVVLMIFCLTYINLYGTGPQQERKPSVHVVKGVENEHTQTQEDTHCGTQDHTRTHHDPYHDDHEEEVGAGGLGADGKEKNNGGPAVPAVAVPSPPRRTAAGDEGMGIPIEEGVEGAEERPSFVALHDYILPSSRIRYYFAATPSQLNRRPSAELIEVPGSGVHRRAHTVGDGTGPGPGPGSGAGSSSKGNKHFKYVNGGRPDSPNQGDGEGRRRAFSDGGERAEKDQLERRTRRALTYGGELEDVQYNHTPTATANDLTPKHSQQKGDYKDQPLQPDEEQNLPTATGSLQTNRQLFVNTSDNNIIKGPPGTTTSTPRRNPASPSSSIRVHGYAKRLSMRASKSSRAGAAPGADGEAGVEGGRGSEVNAQPQQQQPEQQPEQNKQSTLNSAPKGGEPDFTSPRTALPSQPTTLETQQLLADPNPSPDASAPATANSHSNNINGGNSARLTADGSLTNTNTHTNTDTTLVINGHDDDIKTTFVDNSDPLHDDHKFAGDTTCNSNSSTIGYNAGARMRIRLLEVQRRLSQVAHERLHIKRPTEKSRRTRQGLVVCWAFWVSGVGAWTNLLGKAVTKIIAATTTGETSVGAPALWLLMLLLCCVAVVQFKSMAMQMARFPAVQIMPTFNCCFILHQLFEGGFFFQEFYHFASPHMIIYFSVGVVLCMVGITIASRISQNPETNQRQIELVPTKPAASAKADGLHTPPLTPLPTVRQDDE